MKTIFKDFNQNFFSSSKHINWFDEEVVYKLDDNRVIRITLQDIGTRNNFNGYLVEIINKTEGVNVKKFFKFGQYLTMIHRPNTEHYCHVWLCDNNLNWYISRPKDTKELCKKIFEWVEMFK